MTAPRIAARPATMWAVYWRVGKSWHLDYWAVKPTRREAIGAYPMSYKRARKAGRAIALRVDVRPAESEGA